MSDRGWYKYLSDRDIKLLTATTWVKQSNFGLGDRPALVIVDAYYGALGIPREDILDSVKKWPSSCGAEGWRAIDLTAPLVQAARKAGVPVVFTTSFQHKPSPWNRKGKESRKPTSTGVDPYAIVDELAVMQDDIVIEKSLPSAFQGTSLEVVLRAAKIDTILVCGEATSGCVRATVVDGCSMGFKVGIIEECCFDRFESSHSMSLFDMDQKYGDVIDLEFTYKYLASLPHSSEVRPLS